MKKVIVIAVLALGALGGGAYALVASKTEQQSGPATSQSNTISEQNSSSVPKVGTVTVTYTDSGFSPQNIEITKGSTVNFVNKSSMPLWVASDPHPAHTDYPEFDAMRGRDSYPQMGEDFSFTFEKTGTWNYHSHTASGDGTDVGVHPGAIIVK